MMVSQAPPVRRIGALVGALAGALAGLNQVLVTVLTGPPEPFRTIGPFAIIVAGAFGGLIAGSFAARFAWRRPAVATTLMALLTFFFGFTLIVAGLMGLSNGVYLIFLPLGIVAGALSLPGFVGPGSVLWLPGLLSAAGAWCWVVRDMLGGPTETIPGHGPGLGTIVGWSLLVLVVLGSIASIQFVYVLMHLGY